MGPVGLPGLVGLVGLVGHVGLVGIASLLGLSLLWSGFCGVPSWFNSGFSCHLICSKSIFKWKHCL